MGIVRVKVRIANPYRREQVVEVDDALLDTGASQTTIPRRIAEELDLEILGQKRVTTANVVLTVDQSFAYIEIEDRPTVHEVLVSDTYSGVLIGVLTLEGLALAVDPKRHRLVDAELLLL